MRQNIFISSLLIIILVLVVGCGQNDDADASADDNDSKPKEENKEDKKAAQNLGDYNIQLGGEIIEEDDLFIVEGKSNLIPGSRLVGEVIVDDGETVYSDTTELVDDDGNFYMELNHHKYGEAELIIRFEFDSVQDDEVKRHYGEKGQNLEGPFIYKHKTYDGILNKAEARIVYKPNESNDLAIKAPDWYDLPDDYGDTRIWIEVEEITDDGDFFYVHGRSNILEGSEIRIEYRYNRDTTRIKPDGSFDFKFDYEYLEDRDFVITFKPSGHQWNEIEEAYGATGQKLVGNLVVSDKHNTDRQYIEKRIPWDNHSHSKPGQDQSDDGEELDEESDMDEEDEEDGMEDKE